MRIETEKLFGWNNHPKNGKKTIFGRHTDTVEQETLDEFLAEIKPTLITKFGDLEEKHYIFIYENTNPEFDVYPKTTKNHNDYYIEIDFSYNGGMYDLPEYDISIRTMKKSRLQKVKNRFPDHDWED